MSYLQCNCRKTHMLAARLIKAQRDNKRQAYSDVNLDGTKPWSEIFTRLNCTWNVSIWSMERIVLVLHWLGEYQAATGIHEVSNKHQREDSSSSTGIHRSFDMTRKDAQKASEAALRSAGFWYILLTGKETRYDCEFHRNKDFAFFNNMQEIYNVWKYSFSVERQGRKTRRWILTYHAMSSQFYY